MSNASPPSQQIYKFLRADMHSPTGTGKWTLNRWRSVRGALEPCHNGLHGAVIDNLTPFFHETLWLAEIGDEYVWHDDGSMGRKIVAHRMRVVERVETWNDRNARLFAADCAERVLKHFEDRYPEDKRPREAIEVARRFARGEATHDELSASYSASYGAADSAAYSASDSASDSAAYSASDRAAYRAAYSAAYSASYSAADSASDRASDSAAYRAADSAAYRAADSAAYRAAYSAAYSASYSAAYRAAYSAERAWQNRHLADMLGLEWDAEVPS